jgi:hypothetical protein
MYVGIYLEGLRKTTKILGYPLSAKKFEART